MGDVFRIVTAEGHEYDYHGTVEQLVEAHPGAQITGRRVLNPLGEGAYEPYSLADAEAAGAVEAVNYQRLKVDELRAVLEGRGVIIPEGVKKAELIAALEAHDGGAEALWELSSDGDAGDGDKDEATP